MSDTVKLVLFVASVLGLLAFVWIFCSFHKARSFERLTGKHVTTWEAMWVDLRVQEAVK